MPKAVWQVHSAETTFEPIETNPVRDAKSAVSTVDGRGFDERVSRFLHFAIPPFKARRMARHLADVRVIDHRLWESSQRWTDVWNEVKEIDRTTYQQVVRLWANHSRGKLIVIIDGWSDSGAGAKAQVFCCCNAARSAFLYRESFLYAVGSEKAATVLRTISNGLEYANVQKSDLWRVMADGDPCNAPTVRGLNFEITGTDSKISDIEALMDEMQFEMMS